MKLLYKICPWAWSYLMGYFCKRRFRTATWKLKVIKTQIELQPLLEEYVRVSLDSFIKPIDLK